jgi:putative ABC transport system permease protein
MLVGALGVVNTLTMSVIERTQEIGMLRSIGMTRWQVMRMILAEAGLMGIVGGVLGLAFGIILSRIFLLSMTAMSGYKLTYVISAAAVGVGAAISLIVSQLAALLPARRAAQWRILDAIHYE